jgi:hypothetical protein
MTQRREGSQENILPGKIQMVTFAEIKKTTTLRQLSAIAPYTVVLIRRSVLRLTEAYES